MNIEQLYNGSNGYGDSGEGWPVDLLLQRALWYWAFKYEYVWAEGGKKPPNVNNAKLLPDGRKLTKWYNNTNHRYASFKTLLVNNDRAPNTCYIDTLDDSEYYVFGKDNYCGVQYFVEISPGSNRFIYWAESEYVLRLLFLPFIKRTESKVKPGLINNLNMGNTITIGGRTYPRPIRLDISMPPETIAAIKKFMAIENTKQVALYGGLVVVVILIVVLGKKYLIK